MPQHGGRTGGTAVTFVHQTEVRFSATRGGKASDFVLVLEQAGASEAGTRRAEDLVRRSVEGQELRTVLQAPPSLENLAIHVYDRCRHLLPALTAVHVSAEQGTWVVYRPAAPAC